VIHCPYCHGWEVQDQRIVVIDSAGFGGHQALLFRGLSETVTVVVHSGTGPDEHRREQLAAMGVDVVDSTVVAVDDDGVRLADGTALPADAVVVGPRMQPNLSMVSGLAIATEPHPMGIGDVVPTSPMGATNVAGVYAAGNVTDPSNQVLQAAARGAQVGAFVNMDLAESDAAAAVRSQVDARWWDERYGTSGDRMWSGAPNGSLVVELGEATPGAILDIGCGEGADAIWLSQRGWTVTAVDISSVAIERARAAAADAGAEVEWLCGDVLTSPPPPQAYDVVTVQYPALLREAGELALRRLLDAVGPGGTFLVVGHDIDPEMALEHGHDLTRFSDLDDLRRALADGFTIEVDEIRPRPSPPAGTRHVDDAVLRARRIV
jgi:SAM-dependent methyltransferase